MTVPLDKEEIIVTEKGKTGRVPALHPRWKEEMQFVVYHPPPNDLEDQALVEEFMERLAFVDEDLKSLLKLSHQKFWCQLLFDETIQKCVASYLCSAPRLFDENYAKVIPLSCQSRHQSVHRRIFMTCLRMATFKESKEHHLTPSVFGEIIYENFVFDIPKLMDICALYENGNRSILSKMVDNIFTQQPKYYDDLNAIVSTIFQVFGSVLDQCGLKLDSIHGSPQKLSHGKRSTLLTKMIAEVCDILSYLHDTTETLLAFFKVFLPACSIFYRSQFHVMLANFYSAVVPLMKATLKERYSEAPSLMKAMNYKMHRCRAAMLELINLVLYESCIKLIIDGSGEDVNVGDHVEGFLHFWTSTLGEKKFIVDYQTRFPIEEDLLILSQSSYCVDDTRLEFIIEGIAAQFAECDRKMRKKKNRSPTQHYDAEITELEPINAASCLEEDAGACAARKSGIELESLISAVKDLLPDLGDGFIEICLDEYVYDVEKLINALLEDKLPASLQDLDRHAPREATPRETDTGKELEHRYNVYDNDEFDVFTRDSVDTDRIHRGKWNTLDMGILDNKDEVVDSFKSRYELYGNIDAEDVYDTDLYEDEYDDTYDDNIGAEDADSADELSAIRPFVTPRALQKEAEPDVDERQSPSDDDEPKQFTSQRTREHWIEDPAKIRERNEQHWVARGRGRGRGKGSAGHQRDVTGSSKGQGQSSDVTRNRTNKDRHKSTRGNHNRRAMADRKRMKGMGPLN